jgi:replication initiation and membrane attachment protein DnaB
MPMEMLSDFYAAIKEDYRIGTSHIALYMALFHLHQLQPRTNTISIKRSTLMEAAKINGLATYHKCIKDLHELGYIEYIPSYNPANNSTVQLLQIRKRSF